LKRLFAFCLVILASSFALFLGSASGDVGNRGNASPPNGIYTCEWIADHPVQAARAGVTCSPTAPPLVPGAETTFLNPASIGRFGAASLLSTTCIRVPASGEVGQGVFAWYGGYPYTSYWDINGYFDPDYTWYVQNLGGTNVYSEHVTNFNIHVASVANGGLPGSNYYRVGAQNHAPTAVHWQACYA
jgi:hypothetical protein